MVQDFLPMSYPNYKLSEVKNYLRNIVLKIYDKGLDKKIIKSVERGCDYLSAFITRPFKF